MRDFIDKTQEQSGTPLNRDYLMALQGFDAVKTTFQENIIIEENSIGETLTTVFNSDNSITETFVGEKKIIKTTIFHDNRSITEDIS